MSFKYIKKWSDVTEIKQMLLDNFESWASGFWIHENKEVRNITAELIKNVKLNQLVGKSSKSIIVPDEELSENKSESESIDDVLCRFLSKLPNIKTHIKISGKSNFDENFNSQFFRPRYSFWIHFSYSHFIILAV